MRLRTFFVLVLVFVLPLLAVSAYANTVDLGTAANFAVLGSSTVTNTGSTTLINGSVGVDPGSAIVPGSSGFTFAGGSPGTSIVNGAANQAQTDASAAYTTAQGLGGAIDLTGGTLGVGPDATLGPGVYKFTSSVTNLNGTLILDAQNSSSLAEWTFQIGTALTVASASVVEVINIGSGGVGGITWAVGSQTTLNTTSTVLGTFISNTGPVVLLTGATIGCGRAISLTKAVNMDTNTIDTGCTVTAGTGGPGGTGDTITPPTSPVPEPGTFGLLSSGLLAMVFLTFRKSRVSSLSLSC